MEVVRATGLKFRFISYNLRKKYESLYNHESEI
jgi:hypothetical protein